MECGDSCTSLVPVEANEAPHGSCDVVSIRAVGYSTDCMFMWVSSRSFLSLILYLHSSTASESLTTDHINIKYLSG